MFRRNLVFARPGYAESAVRPWLRVGARGVGQGDGRTFRLRLGGSARRGDREVPEKAGNGSLSMVGRSFWGGLFLLSIGLLMGAEETASNFRAPQAEADLRYWLENMVWYHRFNPEEVRAATGLRSEEIAAALIRFDITPSSRPQRIPEAPLLVLPYPGGRHPRIGFLDGAIRPQRETKVSVFTPWADGGYVVLDIPEAIWSNLGLTYLAHSHVPTVWSRLGIELERQEWDRRSDGTLEMERRLPNGIVFGTRVKPAKEAVLMEMWLTNGTEEKLNDLRVQNCVMLKGAEGFNQLHNENKLVIKPYVACRSEDGRRWIISAWEPCDRPWNNAPVPCLHSDPKFPDCAPRETQRLRGWQSFYEGVDIVGELNRIDGTEWRSGIARK